jgi:predicted GTPase
VLITSLRFFLNFLLQLRPIEWANIVFISAKTGQRVKRVLDAASAASAEHRRRVTTSTLNLVLKEAQVGRWLLSKHNCGWPLLVRFVCVVCVFLWMGVCGWVGGWGGV